MSCDEFASQLREGVEAGIVYCFVGISILCKATYQKAQFNFVFVKLFLREQLQLKTFANCAAMLPTKLKSTRSLIVLFGISFNNIDMFFFANISRFSHGTGKSGLGLPEGAGCVLCQANAKVDAYFRSVFARAGDQIAAHDEVALAAALADADDSVGSDF